MYIDQVERMCQKRALEAYGLDPNEWGVNVQPYSGSPANFAVYTGLLAPHSRIMGLDLPSGGHLTHGFYTLNKKTKQRKAVSATSVYFESLPYKVTHETGLIDYDALEASADLFKPALIICGGSAYAREWDYQRFRTVADKNGSILMMDMAHISGLVAAGVVANPFDFCDIVTTTTHKSLRGPRAGMIFYRLDERGFKRKIDMAVFPALQGGPHEHQIAGIATQLKEVQSKEFKAYAQQVCTNARVMADALLELGYKLQGGGTDNHCILWDLRPEGVTGSKLERTCELASITLNKNSVVGDISAFTPGGVRIGSPALTTRGFGEEEFKKVVAFLHRALLIAKRIQANPGCKLLKNFNPALAADAELAALKAEVNTFSKKFPMPGLKYLP
jgi:glycine hydroxymethyltransferase